MVDIHNVMLCDVPIFFNKIDIECAHFLFRPFCIKLGSLLSLLIDFSFVFVFMAIAAYLKTERNIPYQAWWNQWRYESITY